MEATTSRLALVVALLGLTLGSATAQTTTKTTVKTTTKPAAKAPAATTKTTTKTTTAKPVAAPKPAAAPAPAPAPAEAAPRASRAARTGPFEEGTNALNLGIGIGSVYSFGAGYFGGSSSVSPALSISYERGIRPIGPGILGIGGFVGYQGASYDLGGGDKIKYRDILVTVRGAFHYPVTPEFDAYGGVGIGIRHGSTSYEGDYFDALGSSSYNDFVTGIFAGGRYFFTDNIGAFGEVGYDQSFLKVGLTARF